MSEARMKLHKLCEERKIKIEGMDHLVEYYIKSLGWSETKACEYAGDLIKDGTIDEIMVIGGKDIKN